MTAIQTGSPLPDTSSSDTDTETTEADDASNESEGDEVTNNPSDETSSEETGDTTSGQTDDDTTNGDWESTMVNGVTICPELDITERQLRAYVDGAYGLERQHLISGYGRNIPDGVECLGEAIMRNCDDAKADHVDGYTFYVTKGSSAYNSPIFGTQRCYIGMSETGDEEHAATCNLLSIADRPHDSGSFYAWNELEWYLKVTLPEFMADHAFPLDGSHGYIGGGRDRERGGLYYFGNDPVERLASRMECRYQAINFDREED